MYVRMNWSVCVLFMTYIKAKPTTLNFCCRYIYSNMSFGYSKHPACLSLQVIPLHVLVLPTSALTGTSSSPVTTSTRPLSPMCGAWMEYQWNMMEKSSPSTMVMDLSLSWMSVKIDMLGEKLCFNVVWTWQMVHKFVGNTTPLIPLVSNMQLRTAYIVGLVAGFNYIFGNFTDHRATKGSDS